MTRVTRRDAMKIIGGGAAAAAAGLVGAVGDAAAPEATATSANATPPTRAGGVQSPRPNKRALMSSWLEGHGPAGYAPAAFFLHFDPAFHRGQPAVDKHLEYFRQTDMDFVKIQFELPFPVRAEIVRPADWRKMPLYREDFYAPQLDVVKGLVKAAKKDALIVMTVYSPFMCADQTSKAMIQHLKDDPDSVGKGLDVITDSLTIFVKACIAAGVDGFYASTQGGETSRFGNTPVFRDHIKTHDLALMREMQRGTTFNIVHVCDYVAPYADPAPFVDYPGQVVNAPLAFGGRKYAPKELGAIFKRPYMGGMDRHGVLATGTSAEIVRTTQDVLAQAPPRFILGADCTVPSDIPWSNLQTAIATAHARA